MAKRINPTKRKLLDISKQLMMAKGYNATTIDEICGIAEVTKGAFFYYFKTKEDLGISVLDHYWQTRQAQFAEAGWMEEEQPILQIQRFLEVVADVFMNDPDGLTCLAGSFTQELAETNPVIRQQVSELFAEWAQQIKPVLYEAKYAAPLPDQIDVDLVADYIIGAIEGALILAHARNDENIVSQQLSMLSDHLRCMFSP